MSDLNDVLLELRDVGIHRLPEAGDAGARRVGEALARTISGRRRWHRGWARRRIRIGGLVVTPLSLLAVTAVAAAATTVTVLASATSLFESNPNATAEGGVNHEHVIPATVAQVGSAQIPGFGMVAGWSANTSEGGVCWALRLPDGSWAGMARMQASMTTPQNVSAADLTDGSHTPGCFDTRQNADLHWTAPGGLGPLATEAFSDAVVNSAGQTWDIYLGYVTAQGTAATVRDPVSGASSPVSAGGYFMLAEPKDDNPDNSLQVLDAAGQVLQPDYIKTDDAVGTMVPGYRPGPSAAG